MSEPQDLVLQILREIQATQSEIKGDIAVIKDKLVQHSLQLSSQGGSLGEIARILRHLPDCVRQSPTDVLDQLRDLEERVTALENRRQ